MAHNIPDPNVVFPHAYKTSCFLKNVVQAPNVTIGDYTYYDDPQDPTGFEKNNILFNYPEFGDKLTIGKFCCLASGATFIMGAANHRLCSVTTYPFAVFGGAWEENAWGAHRGRGHCGGLLRSDKGRGPLLSGGGQPRPVFEKQV